jgi:hypothetical protein
MRQLKASLSKLNKQIKIWHLKKKLLISGGVFITLVLIYLLVSFLIVQPAEIQLARLKSSWEKEKICHEACSLKRRLASEAIVRALEKEAGGTESRLRRRLKLYFLDKKLSAEFKSELIRIIRQADGPDNPPDYLKNYLSSVDGDVVVQGEILNSFPATSLRPESVEQSPLNYYFTILTGDREFYIKKAAIHALSNYPDKTRYFSDDQLAIIRNLTLDPSTDKRLRQSLIMLLGDYYPLFPTATAEILIEVYTIKTFSDEISRAFAADILNKNDQRNKWPLPDISEATWDEYYNN